MNDLQAPLLESWERQCRIVMAVAGRVDESNRKAKPSPDGWSLDHQLAHIHRVRQEWLASVAPERAASLGDAFVVDWTTPIGDLNALRGLVEASGQAVGETVRELLGKGGEAVGPYDHPVFFLQHMVWHEGWHVGLIMLGLRLAGQEPPEEWEEANVWGHWRTE